MTSLAVRTQAHRRVFRQGIGIKPHFQHTPQYFSPICRCSGMCETSLLDVARTNSGGSRGGNYPLTGTFSLSQDIRTCHTQAATTNINPSTTMNAMRIQASPRWCSDRILLVRCMLVGKTHPGVQPDVDPPRDNPEIDVRGHWTMASPPDDGARLDRLETVNACFEICAGPAPLETTGRGFSRVGGPRDD